jgi:hypothetical protein
MYVRVILAPAAYAPLLYTLACIMPAKRADLIFIPFVHKYVTVRAKIVILCHPRSADVKKSHVLSPLSWAINTRYGANMCLTPHEA